MRELHFFVVKQLLKLVSAPLIVSFLLRSLGLVVAISVRKLGEFNLFGVDRWRRKTKRFDS
jgi:hypothetical protein